MKVRRLMEILLEASPDAEVMCSVMPDDPSQLADMSLLDFEELKKYKIVHGFTKNDDDEYIRLLIKEIPYQYNPKGVRNKR
jgi:hypothetical protein